MMNRIVKGLIFTIGCLILVAGIAQNFKGDVNPFVMNQLQAITQVQQANKANDQKLQKTLNQIATGAETAQQQSLTQTTENNSNMSKPAAPFSAKPMQKALPSCDCRDASSRFNYPSNFIYDNDHNRIERKSPSCKCEVFTAPPAQPIAQPSSNAQQTSDSSQATEPSNTSGEGSSENSYWNIQY